MKNTNQAPIVHRRVSAKDKKKGLLIWAFLLFLGAMTIKGQLDVAYMDVVHAQEPPVVIQDRLGEVLDPKGTIYLKEGTDPAWGTIKEPKMAEVSAYTSRVQETDDTPCVAANGKDICKQHAQGIQTCAANDYKMGTKLKIEGMGTCIVSDRLNKRYTGTGRIDWYMGMDTPAAYRHGVKKLMVTEL